MCQSACLRMTLRGDRSNNKPRVGRVPTSPLHKLFALIKVLPRGLAGSDILPPGLAGQRARENKTSCSAFSPTATRGNESCYCLPWVHARVGRRNLATVEIQEVNCSWCLLQARLSFSDGIFVWTVNGAPLDKVCHLSSLLLFIALSCSH